MKKLVIKNIDIGATDPADYSPEIPENFCIWLNLLIGYKEEEGGELFQVGICTSNWISQQILVNGYFVPRHMILVERFDHLVIRSVLEKIVSDSAREDLQETMKMLCQYFAWEFDDYRIA